MEFPIIFRGESPKLPKQGAESQRWSHLLIIYCHILVFKALLQPYHSVLITNKRKTGLLGMFIEDERHIKL